LLLFTASEASVLTSRVSGHTHAERSEAYSHSSATNHQPGDNWNPHTELFVGRWNGCAT
jgi:hypothetical protein